MSNSKQQTEPVLFFVYGTLKKGWGNHNYCLKGAEALGDFATEPIYTLYDGGFPIVERDGDTSIKGELYRTSDEEQISATFSLEGCPSRTKGHPNNWYDIDYLETPHGKAVIFVMPKGKSRRTEALTNGVWGL